ncbi:lactate dehydrogenase [Gemmobacter fulvus]|uniref:class I SAM-dependent DNA methyltransferase n=1 Tax=Gemmobacter fulvus TaxID=2840474 RepID=UPI00279646AA|nr:DNA methyltransferase [Gemmobacter fulvus]MDQ1850630.1 lactate dehydrogenase [Gemmobacter fulvus]
MNPTEIADALDEIARAPFDAGSFGFSFAEATDNALAAVSKLRSGATNKSDQPNGVLHGTRFHYAPALPGLTDVTLDALRTSKRTLKSKPAILIATDGQTIAAEHPKSGDTLHCAFSELGTQFAFFLPAAGKDRYKAAEENPVDVKATGKLAKLYDALLKTNPDWATPDRRHDMNLFMTRLIFCLFSEDVGVFPENQFSHALFSYSGNKGEHAQDTLIHAFAAMNRPKTDRAGLPAWAAEFEYVNGGLFAGPLNAPRFDPIAFRYLRDAADLNWKLINPDIFGSMIQSIADAKARSELGMHYTSVPNIMKVLGPLFLDDLDGAIDKVWDRAAGLRAQLLRLSHIRVFDPACGSGNFLVVAYREMRDREIRILKRLGELESNPQNIMFSSVSLNQFYGIELNDFAAETAKLALFIAEYQANARFADVFGRMPALLPLRDGGSILGDQNALHIDWEKVCPPPSDGEEVYIAGNPPYLGKGKLTDDQKADMDLVFGGEKIRYGYIDYVGAWFLKGAQYCAGRNAQLALVATNSVGQGRQAPVLWPCVFKRQVEFSFVHTSFKWANNAARKAAVFCVIVGLRPVMSASKYIFTDGTKKLASNITAYFTEGKTIFVHPSSVPVSPNLPRMDLGNKANDDGNLILSPSERADLLNEHPHADSFLRPYLGSKELNNGLERYCLWLTDDCLDAALLIPPIADRIEKNRLFRLSSTDEGNKGLAARPHQMREMKSGSTDGIFVSIMTSQRRNYLACGMVSSRAILSGQAFGVYDAPMWALAVIASRLHFIWVATICGQLKEDYRYSNDLGWNTFPTPQFSADELELLTSSARRILKTRYQHHPKTLSELYDPDEMPEDLRQAHRDNDDMLESMYIGRPFRNDTERLEKLFKLYAARVKQGSK